jgi:hypothetical protein
MECDVYRCSWDIGAKGENKRGIVVKGKEYQCSAGNQPLLQWVEINYQKVWVAAQAGPLIVVCVDCYQKIFGQYPMPSTYEGNEYGRLVTVADEQRRMEQAAFAYSPYGLGPAEPPPPAEDFHTSAMHDLLFAKTPDDLLFDEFVRKARS